jgi:hypothetical protein
LHQRLPARVNLLKRRAFAQNSAVHSEAHLFILFTFSIRVWQLIHAWLGLYTVVPGSILVSFDSFGFPFNFRKRKQGLRMIWQATCWTVWLARNASIFEQKDSSVSEIVEAIKRTSLQWLMAKKSGAVCMAYEWQKFPLEVLLR